MQSTLEEIIENLNKLQGLTRKTSERLLIDLVTNPNQLVNLQTQINQISQFLKVCQICYGLTINGKCQVCDDPTRNQRLICVVSSILEMNNMEKYHQYQGLYAVLGGEINLSRRITPESLKIKEFLARLEKVDEVILGLNATFEGEVTANYLAGLLREKNIKTTRLAKGIPMGATLDYLDQNTLESAFLNRKKVGTN